MGKITFILGGVRSGKSSFAEKLALEEEKAGLSIVYLATCESRLEDPEMTARIDRHKSRRPESWSTVEEPFSPETHIAALPDKSVVLMDCLSLWVNNLLLTLPEGNDDRAADSILSRVRAFFHSAILSRGDVIVVSNETGCGVVPSSHLGRLYRDILGWANQEAAHFADEVWFLVAGLPQKLK